MGRRCLSCRWSLFIVFNGLVYKLNHCFGELPRDGQFFCWGKVFLRWTYSLEGCCSVLREGWVGMICLGGGFRFMLVL